MPRLSRGSVVQLQAINEWIRYVDRAPKAATHPTGFYLHALRGKMRMSQAQLARRSGVDQGQELKTLRKLFGALFCDLLVIPKPRQHLGDALAARNAECERPEHGHTSLWADRPPKQSAGPRGCVR